MLQCRIRLEGLPFDLVQKVWATPQEFDMREFPSLRVGGRALGAWCLEKTGMSMGEEVQALEWNRRTLLILWKPYMFNWRTKLENCGG